MKLKNYWKRFWTLDRHHAAGFTLVELIVVIAILAILAGVAIPVYSGYIKKAETAGDQQLLDTLNTAFAAACIENGTDMNLVDSAYATLNEDGTVNAVYRTAVGDVYNVAFDKYFAGNETSAFKVVTTLVFKNHMFVAGSGAYAGLQGIFSNSDITAFNGSIFANIGLGSLMGQVDMATQVALAADPNSTLGQMIWDDANMESLAGYLDCELESDEFGYAMDALIVKKVDMMIAAGADGSTEEAYEALRGQATKEILANNAVLVAATNSNFDTTDFMAQLAAGNGKNTIKASMNEAGNNQEALAQTALAYAMYTSYITKEGGTPTNNYMDVLDVLESDGFKSYMNTTQATTDMEGYLAAMSMMNTASGNKDAVSSLLVNGFNDPELIAQLTQEVGG